MSFVVIHTDPHHTDFSHEQGELDAIGQLEFAPSAVFSVVMGGMLCAVGVFVLRCRPKAALSGMALYAMALVSGALSYELWSSWAAAEVVARRDYQGLPVREGEVETMAAGRQCSSLEDPH